MIIHEWTAQPLHRWQW